MAHVTLLQLNNQLPPFKTLRYVFLLAFRSIILFFFLFSKNRRTLLRIVDDARLLRNEKKRREVSWNILKIGLRLVVRAATYPPTNRNRVIIHPRFIHYFTPRHTRKAPSSVYEPFSGNGKRREFAQVPRNTRLTGASRALRSRRKQSATLASHRE